MSHFYSNYKDCTALVIWEVNTFMCSVRIYCFELIDLTLSVNNFWRQFPKSWKYVWSIHSDTFQKCCRVGLPRIKSLYLFFHWVSKTSFPRRFFCNFREFAIFCFFSTHLQLPSTACRTERRPIELQEKGLLIFNTPKF